MKMTNYSVIVAEQPYGEAEMEILNLAQQLGAIEPTDAGGAVAPGSVVTFRTADEGFVQALNDTLADFNQPVAVPMPEAPEVVRV